MATPMRPLPPLLKRGKKNPGHNLERVRGFKHTNSKLRTVMTPTDMPQLWAVRLAAKRALGICTDKRTGPAKKSQVASYESTFKNLRKETRMHVEQLIQVICYIEERVATHYDEHERWTKRIADNDDWLEVSCVTVKDLIETGKENGQPSPSLETLHDEIFLQLDLREAPYAGW